MQSQSTTSASISRRHDFDSLTMSHDIDVHPSTSREIPQLTAMARQMVPGVVLTDAQLYYYCALNPETAFSFVRSGALLGGIAFLYLNVFGLDALLLDDIDLRQPATRLLSAPGETPAAIYWWALAARGRGISGMGALTAHFAAERYQNVDFYTQPSSADGTRIIQALGFTPTQSWQPDLWTYRRSARRPSSRLQDAA